MAIDKDLNGRINEKFLVIDKKLKEAFSSVKKDISEVKSSLKEMPKSDSKDIENKIENLKKELDIKIDRIKQLKSPEIDLSVFDKKIDELKKQTNMPLKEDNEKLKLEKQIIEQKIKLVREEQKNKGRGRISRLINRIGVWKEKHKLNKQYRKQLEQINEKHDDFEKELIQKTKDLDKLYSKSIAKLESERQNDKQFFIAQNEQSEKQRSQLIKEISGNIEKSEKRFNTLIRNIESKRQEDNSNVNNQFNLISKQIQNNNQYFQKRIEELQKELDILKSKKIRDEKKILELEQEKSKLQDKLQFKASKTRAFKLPSIPKIKFPKFSLPKINIKSNDIRAGFWMAVPYIFLLILAIVALNQYFHWSQVSNNSTYWIVAGVIFGGLTFWRNRDKIESSMEDEKNQEDLAESKRASEFEYKFPKLSNFNFNYGVVSNWKDGNYLLSILRAIVSPFVFIARLPYSFVKWMYKEGWAYSIGLIAIVVLATFLYFHQLGSFDFREDEFPVVDAAAGYFHSGTFFKWDWIQNQSGQFTECLKEDIYCNYNRAWPHTILVALSYKLFGISEWSSRLISALFGVFMIFLSYLISKMITKSKKISLLFALSMVLNYQFVQLFRYTRMYALLIPFFFLFIFILGRGITDYSKNKNLPPSLSFGYPYLILAIILFLICYLLHINTLIIGPAFLIFLLFSLFFNYKPKYILLFIISLVIIGIIFILIYLKVINLSFLDFLGFLTKPNISYWGFLFNDPFTMLVGASLVLANSIMLFNKKNRSSSELIILLYALVLSAGIFFVYFAVRYAGFTYIAQVVPFAILLVIYSFYQLTKVFNKKILRWLLFTLLIVSLLLSSFSSINSVYSDENSYGKYSVAYPTIVDHYEVGEVIFGQYLKGFYLEGIPVDAKIINMRSNRNYTYEEFINDLLGYKSGWITWETRKSAHISPKIIDYIDKNFEKYNGKGMDNTGIEVYYFSKK